MTDLEKVKEMFIRAGIVFEQTMDENEIILTMDAKEGPNNLGYTGFAASLYFDISGKLKAVGSWE